MTVHERTAEETTVTVIIIPSLLISVVILLTVAMDTNWCPWF